MNVVKNIYVSGSIPKDNKELEKYLFICKLSLFFILEESIIYINEIKNKIYNLKIEEFFKENEIKNCLIKIIQNQIKENPKKDLFSEIWNNINSNTQIVENDVEMNELILSYVNKNNKIQFKKDLIEIIKPVIKDIDNKDP